MQGKIISLNTKFHVQLDVYVTNMYVCNWFQYEPDQDASIVQHMKVIKDQFLQEVPLADKQESPNPYYNLAILSAVEKKFLPSVAFWSNVMLGEY